MISIKDLHVCFGRGTPLEVHALRGIDLNIPQGQFVTVIGSNGAGKSTLLNALSGEIAPEMGRIIIGHQDVTRWPTHKRAKSVARVFQDPKMGTCESLTLEENLALGLSRGQRRSLRPALKSSKVKELKELVASLGLGLENRLKDKIGLLSGGQRQALSLLMATLQPIEILLLDEHTAALDPKTASYVLKLTAEIVEADQLTVMMVTHSMQQALSYGHRTLMLHEGQIIFDIHGEERASTTVADLLNLFERKRGEVLADDALLLG
ncbi:ABC transporter ATP-binding protein [Hahella sp. CCB-MM4]|uniref:ABC transporter ATP-binding protein n=1 Tax=Hahella sp. (strain CCB-MM4) TaxID=1926491 RepID=UPI000B9C4A5E|nr:ABC transporter ATP-binding protein [Hahella sp. CCB-MM4]OZG73871.1 ABC transporter ATP-binding protein [Hahella sp. CCB-MM4]